MEDEGKKIGRRKWSRYIGISLIILTWIFWGMIFVIPFLDLGLKVSAIATTILLIATNIFYIGVFLIGKELAARFNIFKKVKDWWKKRKSGNEI
jgi:hypothetical protein